MKTLSDAADMLANFSFKAMEYAYSPDIDQESKNGYKEKYEMLNIALKVVMEKLDEEKKNAGDRLDKLLDRLDSGCRSLHGIACVCVALSTLEENLMLINEYDAAGRCNEIQHKYLG